MALFLKLFASCIVLLATPAWAVEGINTSPDCGQEEFAMGVLPPANECTYPNVGKIIQDGDLPDFFYASCGASLIYKDNNKAVLVSAAHCMLGYEPYPTWITFEPQPIIPYVNPEFRPKNLTQNLIPVAMLPNGNFSTTVHPLYAAEKITGPESIMRHDLVVFFMDLTNEEVRDALANLQPFSTPQNIGFLDTFSPKELAESNITLVGYSRLNSPSILDETYKVKQGRVPAQHNRKYGAATYVNKTDGRINFQMILSKDQTIGCNGDSGSPAILDHGDQKIVLGVFSIFNGNLCNATSFNWYNRLDHPDNFKFIACAIDPDLSIEQSVECIGNQFSN